MNTSPTPRPLSPKLSVQRRAPGAALTLALRVYLPVVTAR